ncbi:hypothetical protein Tco_0809256 [Tanacetum coccineum]
MSEEDQNVEVVLPVKSDMHSYSSTMTAKDVKALAFKHNIPLDLHPVALTAEWTMDKLPDDCIDRELFLKLWLEATRFWGDIHDPLPTDGFHASDVVILTNQSIDIRPAPSDSFSRWAATTWESLISPIFKDTRGMLSRCLSIYDFPSWMVLLSNRVMPFLLEMLLPHIPLVLYLKARATAKKRCEEKELAGGESRSNCCTNPSFLLKDVDDAGTAESREDEHVSVPPHDSANTTHNHTVDHDESFGESRGHGETVETHPADETRLTESPVPARNPEKTVVQDLVPVVRSNLAGDHADGAESSRPGSVYVPEWTIHRRSRVDTPEECRELLTHLAPPAVREDVTSRIFRSMRHEVLRIHWGYSFGESCIKDLDSLHLGIFVMI